MAHELKRQLLVSANERAYFDLSPPELEELWTRSEQFINTGRLVALEIEWFPILEQHFFLSLLTCRDVVAKLMLKRIMEKFGFDSRRIFMLRTAFVRATQDPKDVAVHLSNLQPIEYDAIKIGTVNLKAAQNWKDYINSLVAYTEQNPVDGEAWAELGETYATVGDYDSAVTAWEQVLLIEPMAYNAFARMAELKKLQAATAISSGFAVAKAQVTSALEHACRSVELNPLYLRGWCGVYVLSGISTAENAGELNEKALGMARRLLGSSIGTADELEAARKILPVDESAPIAAPDSGKSS